MSAYQKLMDLKESFDRGDILDVEYHNQKNNILDYELLNRPQNNIRENDEGKFESNLGRTIFRLLSFLAIIIPTLIFTMKFGFIALLAGIVLLFLNEYVHKTKELNPNISVVFITSLYVLYAYFFWSFTLLMIAGIAAYDGYIGTPNYKDRYYD